MRSDFEYAYFLFLSGFEFRSQMIGCAVDALLQGIEGKNTAGLAGADFEDTESLVTMFRRASKEVGLVLPSKEEEQEWLVMKSFQFRSEGRAMADEDFSKRFERNLLFIFYRLARHGDDPCLRDFTQHYGRYLGTTGCIGGYANWLDELERLRAIVAHSHVSSSLKSIVDGVTALIGGSSYGAIEDNHLTFSQKMVDALMQMSRPPSGCHSTLTGGG